MLLKKIVCQSFEKVSFHEKGILSFVLNYTPYGCIERYNKGVKDGIRIIKASPYKGLKKVLYHKKNS